MVMKKGLIQAELAKWGIALFVLLILIILAGNLLGNIWKSSSVIKEKMFDSDEGEFKVYEAPVELGVHLNQHTLYKAWGQKYSFIDGNLYSIANRTDYQRDLYKLMIIDDYEKFTKSHGEEDLTDIPNRQLSAAQLRASALITKHGDVFDYLPVPIFDSTGRYDGGREILRLKNWILSNNDEFDKIAYNTLAKRTQDQIRNQNIQIENLASFRNYLIEKYKEDS
ncbi:MAG: hypothetical protein ACMXYC_04615 [Candidatus Woesearchaeota archaeon]